MPAVHQLFDAADRREDRSGVGGGLSRAQHYALPGIRLLPALVEAPCELAIAISLGNAPTVSARVLDLPSQALKPLFPTHVRRNFPMRRIMRRNGVIWDAPGRTTCAHAVP